MEKCQVNKLANRLKDSNQLAFRSLFEHFYKDLCLYTNRIVFDYEVCRDIVQDIFVKLWHGRSGLPEFDNFESYLYMSAKNSAFDYLKKLESKDKYQNHIKYESENLQSSSELNDELELKGIIENCIKKLPELSRLIFKFNKIDGLKQKIVAEKMGVSVKTVEWHIANVKKELKKNINKFYFH